MVEQHPNRDRPAALSGHQARQVVANRGVELSLASFDLLHDGRGGERLGDAADAVAQVGGYGTAGADIGDARRAAPHLIAVAHFGEYPRHPRAMDLVQGGIQCCGIE